MTTLATSSTWIRSDNRSAIRLTGVSPSIVNYAEVGATHAGMPIIGWEGREFFPGSMYHPAPFARIVGPYASERDVYAGSIYARV